MDKGTGDATIPPQSMSTSSPSSLHPVTSDRKTPTTGLYRALLQLTFDEEPTHRSLACTLVVQGVGVCRCDACEAACQRQWQTSDSYQMAPCARRGGGRRMDGKLFCLRSCMSRGRVSCAGDGDGNGDGQQHDTNADLVNAHRLSVLCILSWL
ncbi:hypothetical protein BDQ17DRAFT_905702 [Cyathus striatus]|nr:hypothetical protein BDQ17DRAFT_905702 [Cyathus striatus]